MISHAIDIKCIRTVLNSVSLPLRTTLPREPSCFSRDDTAYDSSGRGRLHLKSYPVHLPQAAEHGALQGMDFRLAERRGLVNSIAHNNRSHSEEPMP